MDKKKTWKEIRVAWDWEEWLLKVYRKIFKKKGGK